MLYLQQYYPEPNPVEEIDTELKVFMKHNWQNHIGKGFKDHLERSLGVIGAREKVH